MEYTATWFYRREDRRNFLCKSPFARKNQNVLFSKEKIVGKSTIILQNQGTVMSEIRNQINQSLQYLPKVLLYKYIFCPAWASDIQKCQ